MRHLIVNMLTVADCCVLSDVMLPRRAVSILLCLLWVGWKWSIAGWRIWGEPTGAVIVLPQYVG